MIPAILAALAAAAPIAAPSSAPLATGGTVSIAIRPADAASPAVVAGATEALTDRGFTVLPGEGHAATAAELTIAATDAGATAVRAAKDRAQIVGVGVVVPLGRGGPRVVPLRRMSLTLTIRARGDRTVRWSGTAITVRAATAADGSDEAVTRDLLAALLEAYPTRPGGTISVP